MVSRSHYACPTCRIAVKDPIEKCPSCGELMVCLGKHFKAPRKANKGQWKKIALAVESYPRHHPECYYSNKNATFTNWSLLWWGCRCASFRDFQTVSDVKSARGLRRSRSKNWAASQPTKGRPKPKYDYGRDWKRVT